ncbi:MAG: MotA/TolQ/ExbB proton channel family protein [Rickettsiales bacterium]|nr:MotA/TolQ/ExbB proton channel family protein [Pseudomonadota bacterium]MDA0965467.1 MotA/TolQ/ExbB proton channel family protein [Pseudomonadota bacterium]MDG4542791.1 MotA/TolQ/ExbB proton channel family protein [Rickettsiales bacterium]MDG4544761.1 MotA/TolQ/ExbB proton channel family protein [Rickettsiales bacterium]MDG4546883.1 MotA/TolQ/ExbB proton channel family protein [Rickettsiales bacterium]
MQRSIKHKLVDASTIVGILVAFSLVSTAIYIGGNPEGFFDVRSVLIVILGTFFVTMACFSFPEIIQAQLAMIRTIFYPSEDVSKAAMNAVEIAEISRVKGSLELDSYSHLTRHNPFLKDGVNMIVDHINISEIEGVMNNEVEALAYRHAKSVAVLRKAAEVSPAMGLIGTLIGLVQMLGNLEDTSTIGPSMAVALLTTFYGAIISYMFFSPIASKLERNTKDELLIAKIYIHAVKSIANRESPRKLELFLNSIIPPTKRINYFSSRRNMSSKTG